MVTAFGLVAAGAVPVGLLAWRLGRRVPATLPTPTADDPVFALAYLMTFGLAQPLMLVLAQAAGASGPWLGVVGPVLTAPLFLAGWVWFAGWRWGGWRSVGLGVGVWLAVSPAVYGVHLLAEWMAPEPTEHPLVKLLAAGEGLPLIALSATVATPLVEEVLFRGLLLGWLVRRPEWTAAVAGLAVVVAATTVVGSARWQVVGFVAVLLVGQMMLVRRPTALAVWATSALFALVHAAVWPTPVPLFLLGLALGWAAVRTGGVVAGTVAHGLFNLVSLVFLVRG